MDEELRAEAAEWLRKAMLDLESARILRDARGPCSVACFLCQQAVEKLLKTMLVIAGDLPPRTHDLVDLHARLAGRGGALTIKRQDLGRWTAYAVGSRYPGFPDPQADLDLSEMYAAAAALAEQVKGLVAGGAAFSPA